MKSILVVGGNGFIGSHLMKLPIRDDEVWTVADKKIGSDLHDWKDVNYDTVIFLAADLGQTFSAYLYNIRLCTRFCELFHAIQPHVIFTSSAAVLGSTPYGNSKKLSEHMLGHSFKDLTILRLSNVYGDGDGHGVIDSFINGNRVIYGDGKQIRDYIHVTDVCWAIDKAVVKKKLGTFNISTGKGKSVEQVFKEFGDGKPDYQPARDFDVPFSVLSPLAARQAGLL